MNIRAHIFLNPCTFARSWAIGIFVCVCDCLCVCVCAGASTAVKDKMRKQLYTRIFYKKAETRSPDTSTNRDCDCVFLSFGLVIFVYTYKECNHTKRTRKSSVCKGGHWAEPKNLKGFLLWIWYHINIHQQFFFLFFNIAPPKRRLAHSCL